MPEERAGSTGVLPHFSPFRRCEATAMFEMEFPIPPSVAFEESFGFLLPKKFHPSEFSRQLCEAYRVRCMDVDNVQKWIREFKNGRTNIHNHSGSPDYYCDR